MAVATLTCHMRYVPKSTRASLRLPTHTKSHVFARELDGTQHNSPPPKPNLQPTRAFHHRERVTPLSCRSCHQKSAA